MRILRVLVKPNVLGLHDLTEQQYLYLDEMLLLL